MDNAWASSFSINDTAQHCQEKIIKLLPCSVRKRSLVIQSCTLYYEKGKNKKHNKI